MTDIPQLLAKSKWFLVRLWFLHYRVVVYVCMWMVHVVLLGRAWGPVRAHMGSGPVRFGPGARRVHSMPV